MAEKPQTLITPPGTAKFPHLNQPAYEYAQKFNSPPKFEVTLVYSEGQFEEFKKQLEAEYDRQYKERCEREGKKLNKILRRNSSDIQVPWSEVVDKDTTTLTGEWQVKFTLKESGEGPKGPFTTTVKFADAQGKPIKCPDEQIGGGSILRVAFTPYSWAFGGFGFGLRLKAVQIIDLKTYAPGGNLDEALFEATEGGFVAEEESSEFVGGADF